MKNKKALIVIIVLFIILAVCGGTFAYVYFATDLLKSNSQMFSKYGTMLDMELYNFFYDENIKTYYTNKSANNYENTGVLRVKTGGNTDINTPHHPLYLRKDSTPEPFDVENYLDTCF